MLKWSLNLVMDKLNETMSLSVTNKAHRRRFFSSITKWFYSDATYEDVPSVDIVDLVIILQALGFKLQRFEKIANFSKTEDLRIQISCGVSDYEAILSFPNVCCKCPTVNTGEFWEVTGSGPSSLKTGSSNYINEAGSSLLPPVSKGTSSVVRDVMKCLFTLIQNPIDINQNPEESFPSTGDRFGTLAPLNYLNGLSQRRRHSLESLATAVSLSSELKATASITSNNNEIPKIDSSNELQQSLVVKNNNAPRTPSKLIREKTWDLETRPPSSSTPLPPSTPRPASSPIPQISTGVANISLNVNTTLEIATPLREARRNIDKVLRILATNKTSKTPGSASKKIPVLQKNSPSARKQYTPRNITSSLHKSTSSLGSSIGPASRPSSSASRYSQSKLSLGTNLPSRTNSASKADNLKRTTLTAKRRVSPDFKMESSSASSTYSGSTGNLLIVDKHVRNSYGYLPRQQNSSSSSATSPFLSKKKIFK